MSAYHRPERLAPSDLNLLAACPASAGPRSQFPEWNLDRWVTVKDLIDAWYLTDESDDTAVPEIEGQVMSRLDPVQRQIVSELFKTYRELLPKRSGEMVDRDPPRSEVFDDTGRYYMSGAVQYGLTLDGTTEYVKLKSGVSPVTDDEKAILLEGAEDNEADYIEVRLGDGVVDQMDMPKQHRRRRLQHLFNISDMITAAGRSATKPGLHCFTCKRPAICGQYPTIGSPVGRRDRTVVVSKSWLAKLHPCERQVAWARLYSIPRDPEDPTALVEARRRGTAFHEAVATALIADNPDGAINEYSNMLHEADRNDLLSLWGHHCDLIGSEPFPVEIRDTEYGIGATFSCTGPDTDTSGRHRSDVAVVLVGFADAVGREASGTPAVIEHRTGAAGAHPLEPELYAVGAHLLSGKAPVAVHIHRLRTPNGPQCERIEFTETDIAAAIETLDHAAQQVAQWEPANTLQPKYSVGDWCQRCPFQSRCSNHRDDQPSR